MAYTIEKKEQIFSSATMNYDVVLDFADLVAGDVVQVIIVKFGIGGVNTPAGWVQQASGSRVNQRTQVFTRTVESDSEHNTTVTFSDQFQDEAATAVVSKWRIQGASGTVSASAVEELSTANPDPPLVTTSWGAKNNLYVEYVGMSDDDATVTAASTGFSNINNVQSGFGVDSAVSIGTATKEAVSESENPDPMTLSDSESWVAGVIAYEPLPSPISGVVTLNDAQTQDTKVAICTSTGPLLSDLTVVEVASTDAFGNYAMAAAYDNTKDYVAFPIYFRDDYSGVATSGNTSLLADTGQSFTVDGFSSEQYIVRLTSGTGSGQTRIISDNTATEITVKQPWSVVPDNTSNYEIGKLYSSPVNFHPGTSGA